MGVTALDPGRLGARAEAMIEQLAAISAEPDRLIRLFLTPEHRRAADHIAGWMRAAGMEVDEDALGTVRGRWSPPGASGARKRLLIGSHLDTVIDAGKYDGPLGIIAGILAVEHFATASHPLPFDLDVLAFGDEEGSRFPLGLTSSAATAGAFEPAMLERRDHGGVRFADALENFGGDAAQIPSAAYRKEDAAAYLEVHIEQGPVLEQENLPVGIVTGIVGQYRFEVAVEGEAGHAGTTPMHGRRDALAGAAELVTALEGIARERAHEGVVGTVGRIEALPGASNVIPGKVRFSVDLRAMEDQPRRDALAAFSAQAEAIAAHRGLRIVVEEPLQMPPTPCSPALQDMLVDAVADLGYRPRRLPSGAGHDAQMMSKLCPSAMLFVRCRRGISHNPAEYASPEDMGAAVAALIRFVERFDPSRLAGA
jgi:allantoate deiminase